MKRLPTKKEIEELLSYTTSEWIEVNYIKGRRFTSKANGNSIFLPAAGSRNCMSSFNDTGSYGYYWLSLLHYIDNDRALDLYFYSRGVDCGSSIRCYGRSVRLVSDIPEPGFVDLGLSVYWAGCNEGAIKPEEYGNYYTWDEALKLFNNKMETKTLQIQIPEGHEVDLEKSNLTNGKIVFKKKEVLTYDEVIKELYQGDEKGAWMNNSSEPNALPDFFIPQQSTGLPITNWAICKSAKHAKKLKAINMLLNVAKYLNGDWKPDWNKDSECKYYYYISENHIATDYAYSYMKSIVYFKSRELAEKAIKILGEDVIRQALSTDW